MGGGSSRPAETVREIYIRNTVLPYFTNAKFTGSIEICENVCVRKERRGWWMFSVEVCVQNERRCKSVPGSNIDLTTKYFQESWTLLNTPPVHGYEANQMTALRNKLIERLEEMCQAKSFRVNSVTKAMVEKIIDNYFEVARSKFKLDSDYNTQFNACRYYINTIISLPGVASDKKFIGMIAGLNKSAMYHVLPSARGSQASGSLNLYNLHYNFLLGKIITQFRNGNVLPGNFWINTPADTRILFNMCVKIIEDKSLNKYGDGEDIDGIQRENFTDEDIRGYNIFEDLETFKSACKYFMFLYRKKICTKYMQGKNPPTPDNNTYRNCKIAGIEAKNKPPEEVARLKKKEDSDNEGESTDITDENRDRIERQKNKEKFTNHKVVEHFTKDEVKEHFTKDEVKEHFKENNIFKQVEGNLKLVLGYVLVLVIIGILIVLTPSIFNTVYGIIEKFLIPTIVYILSIFAQIFTIIGKTLLMTGEGLVFFVVGIIGSIIGTLKITLGLTFDFLKDIVISIGSALGLTTNIVSNVAANTVSNVGNTAGVTGSLVTNLAYNSAGVVKDTIGIGSKVAVDAAIATTNVLGIGSKVAVDTLIGTTNVLGIVSKVAADAIIGTTNVIGIGSKVSAYAIIGTTNAALGSTNVLGIGSKIATDGVIATTNVVGNTLGVTGNVAYNTLGQSVVTTGSTISLLGKTIYDVTTGIGSGVISTGSILSTMTYDMIFKTLQYFIDQISNIYTISKESGFSIIQIFSGIVALIFKIIYDAGYGTGLLIHDLISALLIMLVKGPVALLGMISKNVFDNSKKIFMTINNIEE
jgi:hypothetical protein